MIGPLILFRQENVELANIFCVELLAFDLGCRPYLFPLLAILATESPRGQKHAAGYTYDLDGYMDPFAHGFGVEGGFGDESPRAQLAAKICRTE